MFYSDRAVKLRAKVHTTEHQGASADTFQKDLAVIEVDKSRQNLEQKSLETKERTIIGNTNLGDELVYGSTVSGSIRSVQTCSSTPTTVCIRGEESNTHQSVLDSLVLRKQDLVSEDRTSGSRGGTHREIDEGLATITVEEDVDTKIIRCSSIVCIVGYKRFLGTRDLESHIQATAVII